MKSKFIFNLVFTLMICSGTLQAQTVYYIAANQAMPLVADAGQDTSIIEGNSVQLGGDPSAMDGYGFYVYLWEPATGLDDPTASNPIATPASTTTYVLLVTDIQGCTAQSSVIVSTLIGIHDISTSSDIKIFPNPTNDFVTIEFINITGWMNLEICNYLGSCLYEEQILVDPQRQKVIDFRLFGKGVFIINLFGKDSNIQKMIINQ